MSPIGFGGNPAGFDMEEAPVLEPLEHSVLKKPLDVGSLEGRLVMDWFVRLIMEPLEHSVLATASVWEPLEHSNCVVTDHVDIDSFWMAPWDAGGTLGDSCRPYGTSWRTVFHFVVRLSCRPAFVDVDCPRLFRSLGQICVLDVHVGQTDVPTGSPGDDPRRNLLPSPMSPGDGGVSLSLSVPLMGKSSRRSGITGKGHSPGMVLTTAMCFPRTDATPGDRCAIDLDMTIATDFPRTDATPGERYVIGLDITTVPNFPRTGATPGEMCTMDVEFIPGEIGAVELGCRTVWGFPQIDSAPGECGAVELDFRRRAFCQARVARKSVTI